jgi:hypothetical protein
MIASRPLPPPPPPPTAPILLPQYTYADANAARGCTTSGDASVVTHPPPWLMSSCQEIRLMRDAISLGG